MSLAEAKKLKASYCDIRIIRTRQQFLSIRLNPERGTGKTLEVPGVGDGGSFGFGVRVIVDGAWGFAASPLVQPEEIARITAEAVQVAKANASLMNKPVVLAPVPAYTDYWQTPHQRDPFEVPIQEKLELIRSAAAEAKKIAAGLLRRLHPGLPQGGQVLRLFGGFQYSAAQPADLRHRQFHRRRSGQGPLEDPSIPTAPRDRRL